MKTNLKAMENKAYPGYTAFNGKAPDPGRYIIQVDLADENDTRCDTWFELADIDDDGKIVRACFDFETNGPNSHTPASLDGAVPVAWEPFPYKTESHQEKDMNIIENPNPVKTHVFTCGKCSCKFECRDCEIKHKHGSDANGRIGGTHFWSSTSYVDCPNCGERIVVARKSGYGSSVIGDQHVTEDWSVIADGNPDDLPDTVKDTVNAK